MARSIAGPFRSQQFTANTLITSKRGWLGTYTIANASAASVTVTFYDEATLGLTNPFETIVIPAGQSQGIYPNADTQIGLSVGCSAWASVTASVRWAAA